MDESASGVTGNQLTFMRARYYSAGVAKFICKDQFAGNAGQPETSNRFAYAGGNPMSKTDPSGYFSQESAINLLADFGNHETSPMARAEFKFLTGKELPNMCGVGAAREAPADYSPPHDLKSRIALTIISGGMDPLGALYLQDQMACKHHDRKLKDNDANFGDLNNTIVQNAHLTLFAETSSIPMKMVFGTNIARHSARLFFDGRMDSGKPSVTSQ